MCFYSFLRSGEITVASMAEFDPEGHLCESDVALDRLKNPEVVRVHIKASKTDPFRQGVFVFIGKTDNNRCPVAAITAYLAIRGRENGPFFKWNSGSLLSRETFVKRVRKTLRASGMDVSILWPQFPHWSGYSCSCCRFRRLFDENIRAVAELSLSDICSNP